MRLLACVSTAAALGARCAGLGQERVERLGFCFALRAAAVEHVH
jgi:hypothetical protein